MHARPLKSTLLTAALLAVMTAIASPQSKAEETSGGAKPIGYLGFPIGFAQFHEHSPLTFGARGGWVLSPDFTFGAFFLHAGLSETMQDSLGSAISNTSRLFIGAEFFGHLSGASNIPQGFKVGVKAGWAAKSTTIERGTQRTYAPSVSNPFVGFATGYGFALGGAFTAGPELSIIAWDSTLYLWGIAEIRLWL